MIWNTWKRPIAAISLVMLLAGNVRADVDSATAEVAGKTSGLIKTISDALKGGELGAAAQSQLIEMCGAASFLLAILFVSYLVASWVGRGIGVAVSKRIDTTLGKFLSKGVRNLIMVVVAMVALERYAGFNVAGLAAILAAAGFAIGMALQGTLGNFAAGVMLLVFRPFKIDDYIVVAGTAGTVEEIDLFTTRLNSPDNRHVIIPNAEIFGAKLENYSRNSLRRVDVNVGTAYSADLDATRQALQQAIQTVQTTLTVPPKTTIPDSQVYLQDLGASSVNWQLRLWCQTKEYWKVRERLTVAAKQQLDLARISIPFPQMDVHVVGQVMAKSMRAA